MYPHSNIWEVLRQRNIFFNVKSGFYQGDLNDLVFSLQREEKIKYLESRIQELINLSKQRKEKIVEFYSTYSDSEKESINKLIESYLEFIRFKKKKVDSPNYDEKYSEYEKQYKELEKKL